MDMIIARSEEFAETGTTRFKHWELKSWFNAQRLGKNVWRNLHENIQDRTPNADVRVFQNDSEFVFIDNARIQKLEDWT